MDQGYYGPLMRMADKLVDQCAMAEIVRAQAPGMNDYKDLRAKASAAEADEDAETTRAAEAAGGASDARSGDDDAKPAPGRRSSSAGRKRRAQ